MVNEEQEEEYEALEAIYPEIERFHPSEEANPDDYHPLEFAIDLAKIVIMVDVDRTTGDTSEMVGSLFSCN